MAGKPLKPQGKSNRNGKTPSKATPARTTQKPNAGAAGKKPAVRTSGLVKKAAPQKTSTPTRKTSSPRTAAGNSGLSVDRKLDILGIVLALGGILSVLSLMSVSNGSITASWELLLSRAFGWGKYLFPFGMLAAGLWLILRKFERIPQLAVERLAGLFLLFLNVLAWFHFFSYIREGVNPMELAALGTGGGYIGGGILYLLLGALGRGGTAIALIAWSLISLALTLDRTIIELFNWASPIVSGAWRRFLESWPQPAGRPAEMPPDYGGGFAPPPAEGAAVEVGDEAVDCPDEGGLPGAGRAGHQDEVTRVDRQIDGSQGWLALMRVAVAEMVEPDHRRGSTTAGTVSRTQAMPSATSKGGQRSVG